MSHKNTAQDKSCLSPSEASVTRDKKVGLIVNFHDKLLIWLLVLIRI